MDVSTGLMALKRLTKMLDNDRASVPPPDHDFIIYLHKILSDLTPSSQRLSIVFLS